MLILSFITFCEAYNAADDFNESLEYVHCNKNHIGCNNNVDAIHEGAVIVIIVDIHIDIGACPHVAEVEP